MNRQTRRMVVGLFMVYLFAQLLEHNLEVFFASQGTNTFALCASTGHFFLLCVGATLIWKSLKRGQGAEHKNHESIEKGNN